MTEFQGFERPTTTPVPDELFDGLMADLSGAELKVLLYIIRRTWGFKKAVDAIGLDQLETGIIKANGERLDHGTGLSRRAIIDAAESLAAKNIIVKRRRGPNPTEYSLLIKGEISAPQAPKEVQKPSLHVDEEVQKVHPKRAKSAPQKVQKVHPQQTVFQQTDSQQTVKTESAANAAAPLPSAEPSTPKPLTPQQALVKAFAEVMHVNGSLMAGKIAGLVGDLRKAGPEPTPELIQAKYGPGGWHWRYDWRGHDRNEPPNMASIRESWGVWAENAPTVNANGHARAAPTRHERNMQVLDAWEAKQNGASSPENGQVVEGRVIRHG